MPSGEQTVRIWPGVAPGSESWSHDEDALTDPDSGLLLIRNVVTPTLTPVLPAAGTANGAAVVVAPGGGFAALAWDHEGTSTARWFADRGVTAFVLKYRLAPLPADPAELAATLTERLGPFPDDPEARGAWMFQAIGNAWQLAAADGEQAVRVLREQAATWGLDASRIGILGYSAGGTVALQAAVTTDADARPAFVANIYGAFLAGDVTADAPPYFGVVAADDSLCLDFCLDAARKWREAGVPAELHVFERGGHGFGMRPQSLPVDRWPDQLEAWLASRDFLR